MLSQINLGAVAADDFDIEENGAVFLKDIARKKNLSAWQTRKQETITHPFLGKNCSGELVPYSQAMLLARWLRVALYIYPFFRKRGIMLILVTYDVSLADSRGQKRLRHVAKICQ